MEYLNDHPTATEILAAVHQVKPKNSSSYIRKTRKALKDAGFSEKEFNQVPMMLGQMPDKLDDELLESMKFAEELKNKMKIN